MLEIGPNGATMNTAMICLVLAIGLIAMLVRFTRPKLRVKATWATHIEVASETGGERKVSSVSMSYDPEGRHRRDVREWKQGWIDTLLVGAFIAVGIIGFYAFRNSPGEGSVPDLHASQFWFSATAAVIVAGVGIKAWSEDHPRVWIYFMMAASNAVMAFTTGAKLINTVAVILAMLITAWAAFLVFSRRKSEIVIDRPTH